MLNKEDKKMESEKSINNLRRLVELRKNKCDEIKFDTCICSTKDLEIVLQALERYKRLAEENLKDNEEFKNNMCEHRCILKSELQEIQENSIPKKKIEDKTKEQIEEADEVLIAKEYIDNFEGSEENQEYYYNGYKDASLFIRELLEGK